MTQQSPSIRHVLVALMMAIFLGSLDQTIVAVSMPAISAQFQDVSLLAWVISGYMVATTVSVPIYGKFGDLYGRRRMMLIGLSIFTLASIFCALAQNMEQLVLARIIQGIGAGGMISVSQAIIGDLVPPRERGRYQGYISSMYALSSVIGPMVGGFLTEWLSWRCVFWINLPLGGLTLYFAATTLRGLPTGIRRPIIDYVGTALLILGLSSLLMGITEIGQGLPWNRTPVAGWLGLAVVTLALFVWQERRAAEPLLPMPLFLNKAAVLCWCTVFFTSFQAISLSMLVPLRFQSVTGLGADAAALHLLPLALGLPLGAFLAGRHTAHNSRYKPQILLGASLMPCAIVGMSFSAPESWLWSGLFMALTGFACGLQFPTSLVGAQNAVEQKQIGVATSTTNLFRSLGGAMGVACMSALLLVLLEGTQLVQGDMHGGGEALLRGLGELQGPALQQLQAELGETFRHLLWGSAAVALLGLAAAIALPNKVLRGR